MLNAVDQTLAEVGLLSAMQGVRIGQHADVPSPVVAIRRPGECSRALPGNPWS